MNFHRLCLLGLAGFSMAFIHGLVSFQTNSLASLILYGLGMAAFAMPIFRSFTRFRVERGNPVENLRRDKGD